MNVNQLEFDCICKLNSPLHLFGYNFICLFISYTLKGIVIQKKTVVHASKDNGLFIQTSRRFILYLLPSTKQG